MHSEITTSDISDGDKEMQKRVHATLTKKFLDLMKEYQSIQTDYKNKYKERLQRTAEIVKPGITEEEVDTLVKQGTDASLLFSNEITADERRHTQAKNALFLIQEQKRDIEHLEKSINQLHQLFADMASIVENQAEILDLVEQNITDAVISSGKSVKSLTAAEESARARRKRLGIICCVIISVLLVAGGVVAAVLMAKFGVFA